MPSAPAVHEAVLQAQGLVVQYPQVRALDHLDLSIGRGVTAVVGPNGAGKTTLIEIAEGLRAPDQGAIEVLGVNPRTATAQERSRVGVMLQTGGIASGARAVEHIEHIASMYRHPLDTNALCERLGLTDLGRTPYRRMSGGQKQLVALAAAVVGRPQLIFLDEPTAGLDPAARVRTWDLIAELSGAGADVIVTTHYLAEAEALADDIVLIHHGRVVAQGAPEILRANHSTPGVRIVSAAVLSDDQLRERLIRDLSHTLGIPVGCVVGSHDVVITGGDLVVLRQAIVQWFATSAVALEGLADAEADLEEVFFALTTSDNP